MKRIGAVCHFHAERFALGPWIEAAEKMFDEIVLVSSPMDGTPADPETIAIAEASGHRLIHDTLSQGFGALRTRCIGYSSCEWVMILDADERVWPTVPDLSVFGTEKFPDTLTPYLHIERNPVTCYDQHLILRQWTTWADKEGALAICVSRRHWMGAPGEWSKPAQNWHLEADPQLRLVKNSQWLCFDPEVLIHETLKDVRTWADPQFVRVTDGSLFIDHFSHHYRAMEPEQNAEDIATYEKLAPGCTKDMWISHQPQKV